jgi:hypothetical protein
VSQAAYKAIVATLSDDMVPIPPQKTPQGEYLLILDQRDAGELDPASWADGELQRRDPADSG